jgi:indole-3-glycerol phosphate synthase
MKKSKISFKEVFFYRIVSANLQDLSDVNYDIIAFFSPADIRSLFENFPTFAQNNTVIAAWGATTIKAIKDEKLKEVVKLKQQFSYTFFEEQELFNSATHSMKKSIESSVTGGIISEFKRKSPAKGNINLKADVVAITQGYSNALVSGLSVLTDKVFFGAEGDDFFLAREANTIPMLRKDFIVDEFQIIQSKSLGADVILLIAKMLSKQQLKSFTKLTHELGMEVFLETQNETEILENLDLNFDLIGINNRNLNSFEVSVENSIKLAELLPQKTIKIAESGIDSLETIQLLKANGFDGFLIGEYFMKEENPAKKCFDLIQKIKA